jgi:DNA-binding transcriptional LysR family regulator
MNLYDSMRAFTRVVEAGGFAAAARDMGVARSVVHKHVLKLEDKLGTQLLRRSTRQVSTTETGHAFYLRCVQILEETDAAIAQVSELQDKPRGELRINAPMSFGTLHLAPLIGAFMAQYPDVHVELALNDRFVDPIEEGFDISIRISAPRIFTSLITREICPARLVLCASSTYLAANGEPTAPEDLLQQRCLHYGYQESGLRWLLTRAGKDISVAINCAMWSNNGEVLAQAALRHQGIALLPTFIAGAYLQSGQLRTVLTAYAPAPLQVTALYPRHRHLSSKVRLFIALLESHLGQNPHWDLVG